MCGGCSNRKFLLPYQSIKPLRVCISCFDALNTAQADGERGAGLVLLPLCVVCRKHFLMIDLLVHIIGFTPHGSSPITNSSISSGAVPPSTLVVPPSDGHDYETQDDWDESPPSPPPHEFYSHYPSDDKVGSSEDDDEEEDDPHYEPVSFTPLVLQNIYFLLYNFAD